MLGFVQRNITNCSEEIKELAYRTLVRPHLEYASSVWDPHHQTEIDKIEKVQRRAARYVKADFRQTSSVTKMLNDLNWRPLKVGTFYQNFPLI